MPIKAVLTVGWERNPESDVSAPELHERAAASGEKYEQTLAASLKDFESPVAIDELDRLFRRRTKGFDDIKKFVGALITILDDDKSLGPVICNIDVFAYAFLKGAKNFDLLLPEDKPTGSFRSIFPQWKAEIRELEDFERFGKTISQDSKDKYLKLRKIIIRKSARDECRSLATLLVSGPSTLDEISDDLALNYPLSQRTIGAFTMIGVVEKRPADDKYVISTAVLPMVVFGLREMMGLDLLNILD